MASNYSVRKEPAIVVIGGGTGSFAMLRALKLLTPDITALVSMADDGGSTGVLRDELGVLPPGDVRKCLVALSEAPEEMRELFNFRFAEGTFAGHSFGNLFLSAVEKMSNNFAIGVRMASELLRITGRVVPITLDNVRLVLNAEDGSQIKGQAAIDSSHLSASRRVRLSLEPAARLNPEAEAAISHADLIVIAPGDIYTSLGPLLIVDGVDKALSEAKGTVVYMCNLVAKPGQTDGFDVADHADEIERFAGSPVIDTVLYNTAKPSGALLQKYAQAGELLVQGPITKLRNRHYRTVGVPLIAHEAVEQTRHDALTTPHSYIRHDVDAVRAAIQQILAGL